MVISVNVVTREVLVYCGYNKIVSGALIKRVNAGTEYAIRKENIYMCVCVWMV